MTGVSGGIGFPQREDRAHVAMASSRKTESRIGKQMGEMPIQISKQGLRVSKYRAEPGNVFALHGREKNLAALDLGLTAGSSVSRTHG
jgi:hypothetical protein